MAQAETAVLTALLDSAPALGSDRIPDNQARVNHAIEELEKRGIYVSPEASTLPQALGPVLVGNEAILTVGVSKSIQKLEIAFYDTPESQTPYAVLPLTDADRFNRANYDICTKKFEGPGVENLYYHYVADGVLAMDPKSPAVAGEHRWIRPDALKYEHGPDAPDTVILDELLKGNLSTPAFEMAKSALFSMRDFPPIPKSEHVKVKQYEKVVLEVQPLSTIGCEHIPEEIQGKVSAISSDAFIVHMKKIGVTTIKFPPLHYAIDESFLKTPEYVRSMILEKYGKDAKDVNGEALRDHNGKKIRTIDPDFANKKFEEYMAQGKFGENAWGYNTAHFLGLNPRYFISKDPKEQIRELREVIKKLHAHGFEVCADFVVAHNCEYTPKRGPAMSMRVLAEDQYFRLTKDGKHINASACGNSIDSNTELSADLILHTADFYRNTLGFDMLRIDQNNILMRDSNHNFERQHPLQRFLFDMYGRYQIMAETTDEFNQDDPTKRRTNTHYGDFPEGTTEVAFRCRDFMEKFGKLVKESEYFRGHRFQEMDRGVRKPVTAILAYQFSGNSDMYPEGGVKRDINFLACHDGKRPIDLAIEIWETLRKANVVMRASKAETILAIARAMEARATIFISGPSKISIGSEDLRTQKRLHNGWDKKELLKYNINPENIDLDNATTKERNLEFFRRAMQLRKGDFSQFFERIEHFSEKELTWHNPQGEQVRSEADWYNLDAFIGQMYHAKGEAFSHGSIYEVTTMKPCTIKLPVPPEGMQWIRRFDSQFPDPREQFNEVSLFSEYIFNVPTTAIFELRAIPSNINAETA